MRPALVLAVAPLLAVPLLVAVPADAAAPASRPQAGAVLTPSALIPTTVSGFPGKAVTINAGKTWSARVTVSGPRGRLVLLQRLSAGRWVAAKSVRTSARRVAAFTVAQAKAGTFRYRVVVPRVGLFAARTTAAKVITVKKVDLRLLPQTITGTFSGSDNHLSWSGTVTLTLKRREVRSFDDTFPVAGAYEVSALTGSYTVKSSWFVGDQCTHSGGGTISRADVLTSESFGAGGITKVSDPSLFDPWASGGAGPVYDIRFRFDTSTSPTWPATRVCPDSPSSNGSDPAYKPFLALATADGIDAIVGLDGPVPTSDGETFAGTLPSNYQGTTFSWNLTGQVPFAFPRPGT